ncbi:hypothetical protein KAR91_13930 [Candidatus Pacearchaeota archaeon]|nr:hypothetical protein [Candidatus Pacearchaeota archaeon]
MKAYNALRDAVKDASKLPTPTDRDCKLPEIAVGLFEKELAESGDAPECTCVVNAEPNPWCPKCTDTGNQPAVQILVRGGKPYRVCDTWIAVEAFETIPKDSHEGRWWNRADKCICPDYAYHLITPFTKDHPLWLAWRAFNCPTTTHTTTDAPEIHTSFIPDGLYSVVECEACEGLGNETYKDETETEFAVLASHSRPTCGGTGKTLKRTEDQHE